MRTALRLAVFVALLSCPRDVQAWGKSGPGTPFAANKEEARRLISCWIGCLEKQVDSKGNPFAHDFLVGLLDEKWARKVAQLREFVAADPKDPLQASALKDASEFQWSDLEREALDTLREEVKDNPLFNNTSANYRRRIQKYEDACEEAHAGNLTERQKKLVARMQAWVDAEVARRVTPEMERGQVLIGRAEALRAFIGDDIWDAYRDRVSENELSTALTQGSSVKSYFAFQRLKELGALSFSEPLTPEKAKGLTELERLLYDYLWAAYPKNPVFEDPERGLPRDRSELGQRYRTYSEQLRPEKEEEAYCALWNYMTRDLRKLTGDPERVPRSRFNWRVWTTVSVVAALAVALAAGVFWRSRRRNQPTS